MRTIIAANRQATLQDVRDAMDACGWIPSVVISSEAPGDFGEEWAQQKGIPVRIFPVMWDIHKRSTSMLSDRNMLMNADALVAIGTKFHRTDFLVKLANDLDLKVFVFNVPDE